MVKFTRVPQGFFFVYSLRARAAGPGQSKAGGQEEQADGEEVVVAAAAAGHPGGVTHPQGPHQGYIHPHPHSSHTQRERSGRGVGSHSEKG